MVNGFKIYISNLIDSLIPEEEKLDVNLYRKGRIRVSILFIALALYTVYMANVLFFIRYQLWFSILALTTEILAIYLYKKRVNFEIVAHVHTLGSAWIILGNNFIAGALENTTALMLIPSVAMLFGNRKVSTIWFGITVAYLTLVYILKLNNFPFIIDYKPEFKDYLLYSNTVGQLVALFIVIWVFEREKELASNAQIKLNSELALEKLKSDELLHNILPEEIANEIKLTGKTEARQYNEVTVLFTDFVNFTTISGSMSPAELVKEINQIYTEFDTIIENHGLEKIKTIGDSYMAASGLPVESKDHAEKALLAAMDIRDFIESRQGKFEVRLGLNSGSVVAGIVGTKKYAYDIWGDDVNIASRMESKGEPGKINISGSTYAAVKDKFDCTYRGKINAKGKGDIDMYFVNGPI